MYDIIVIGHLLKEFIMFPDGKKTGPLLGGPAAYSSVAASRLGFKVGIVTKIGTDMPEGLLKVFKETGVDTKGIIIGEKTTTNHLIYNKKGKKKLKFLNRAEDIYFDDIPKEYLESKFFLIAAVNYEIKKTTLNELYVRGKKMSMELSGFGGASSQTDKTKEKKVHLLSRISKYFEIVKGSREDYECIFDKKNDINNSNRKFIHWGTKISITTLGDAGSIIRTKNSCMQVAPIPVKVVDATGAGDV